MSKIGFIGTGNLASSIIKGLVQSRTEDDIHLFDVMREKADLLAEQYHVSSGSFSEVAAHSDILIVAVKPKDIKSLLQELASVMNPPSGKLIISTAAGIGLSFYEAALPDMAFIRVMPNTSSAVLQSVTGMVRGKQVTEEQAQIAGRIFSVLGKILWVEDSKMNALTAVSGSGPAYFYLLTELMARAGEKLGLTQEEAQLLARETLAGAGKMLAEDKRSPQELREAVTSPNGTTYAAVNAFLADGLEEIVNKALAACAKRAEEMEGEYS